MPAAAPRRRRRLSCHGARTGRHAAETGPLVLTGCGWAGGTGRLP
ncbi:hypothetical protein [Streptomyces sp. NPDC002845]